MKLAIDWNIVQQQYDSGKLLDDICRKFNFSYSYLRIAIKRGCLKTRTTLETKRFRQKLGYKYFDRKQSLETRNKLSIIGRKSKHRRILKSTRNYTCKDGTVVLLDSSWEECLAKRLDELDVLWIRPKIPLKWIDHQNKDHNYFPDFYLPKFDIYLDPKNPIVYIKQQEKINYLLKNYKNIYFLKTLEECKHFNAPVAQLDRAEDF